MYPPFSEFSIYNAYHKPRQIFSVDLALSEPGAEHPVSPPQTFCNSIYRFPAVSGMNIYPHHLHTENFINEKKDNKPLHSLISAFVFHCLDSIITLTRFYSRNFKTLASFCGCTGRFGSYLVANPEDTFCCVVDHIYFVCAKYQKATVKALVQVDFPVYPLSKHKQSPRKQEKHGYVHKAVIFIKLIFGIKLLHANVLFVFTV